MGLLKNTLAEGEKRQGQKLRLFYFKLLCIIAASFRFIAV